MSNNTGFFSCRNTCWIIGLLLGLAALLLARGRMEYSFILALVIGIVVFFVAGWLLKMIFCTSAVEDAADTVASGATKAAGATAAGVGAVAAGTASAANRAGGAVAGAASDTVTGAKNLASGTRSGTKAAPSAGRGRAKTTSTAKRASTSKSSTAKKPAAKKPAAKKPASKTTKTTKPAASAASGKSKKPSTMNAPRASGPDDLKQLKGVGPKLEGVLNRLGFWHFDQIAKWTAAEVSWVDDNLQFKGRIERDGWIEQAKILARGGQTEFSKKVKKGKMY